MNDRPKVMSEVSQAGYEFLMSDVDLAMTLARIASHAGSDGHKRTRNIQNARRAYDTVRELVPRVGLTGEQQKRVTEKLIALKSVLKKLGQRI